MKKNKTQANNADKINNDGEMENVPSGPPRLVYVLVEWRLSRDPRKSRPGNEKKQKLKN